jgi:hypothetical protein
MVSFEYDALLVNPSLMYAVALACCVAPFSQTPYMTQFIITRTPYIAFSSRSGAHLWPALIKSNPRRLNALASLSPAGDAVVDTMKGLPSLGVHVCFRTSSLIVSCKLSYSRRFDSTDRVARFNDRQMYCKTYLLADCQGTCHPVRPGNNPHSLSLHPTCCTVSISTNTFAKSTTRRHGHSRK